jgi:hypothetical protein
MGRRHRGRPDDEGGRRSVGAYDQSGEEVQLRPGDRFFVRCEGGPASSRLEIFPPRLEIAERDGVYVLVDDGPRDDWHYVFLPRTL